MDELKAELLALADRIYQKGHSDGVAAGGVDQGKIDQAVSEDRTRIIEGLAPTLDNNKDSLLSNLRSLIRPS